MKFQKNARNAKIANVARSVTVTAYIECKRGTRILYNFKTFVRIYVFFSRFLHFFHSCIYIFISFFKYIYMC